MSEERDRPVGPATEQLGLGEEVARLCAIGELMLAGHAPGFALTRYERAFLAGYLSASPRNGPRNGPE